MLHGRAIGDTERRHPVYRLRVALGLEPDDRHRGVSHGDDLHDVENDNLRLDSSTRRLPIHHEIVVEEETGTDCFGIRLRHHVHDLLCRIAGGDAVRVAITFPDRERLPPDHHGDGTEGDDHPGEDELLPFTC